MNSSTALQPLPVLARRRRGGERRPPGPPEPAVRITRRGRLVLLVARRGPGLRPDLAGPGGRSGRSSGCGGRRRARSARTWVVQPGETLWVIAERLDPTTDPRETVARIVAMNDLPSSSVLAGQELLIPA